MIVLAVVYIATACLLVACWGERITVDPPEEREDANMSAFDA